MVTGLEVWYFRKDGSTFDPHTIYADHPEVFSMKVFHGGSFTPSPNRRYFGGKVQYVDLLDIEQFTVNILHSVVKMLKYDTRDIMYYHFKIPGSNLDWGLRALASDDDIVNLSKYVKDNKVIEVYFEHGETTVESYYMPTFKEKLQLNEIDNNVEVVELDGELPIVPQTRKRKFLGIPKCRKHLAIEWLSNAEDVGQHSGLANDENDGVDDHARTAENDGVDDNARTAENDGVDGHARTDENDGVDDHARTDENDGVDDIVDDEHIIDPVDVNMEGFRFTTSTGENDRIRPQLNINEEDIKVIDYDEFDSELDEDDVGSIRSYALRKLKKKGNVSSESGIVNYFYVGQEFGNREEVKERIRAYSVESRRNVDIVKNDNIRVRARCEGIVPNNTDVALESSTGDRRDKVKKGRKVISEDVGEKYKCPWSVYVAKANNGKWQVRTVNKDHICLHSRKVKHCTSTFLSKHVTDLGFGHSRIIHEI